MRRYPLIIVCILISAAAAHSQQAPDAAELTRLLNDFLAGASRNDAAMHDRFWADDLIYTGSAGRRIGKADIMRDIRSAPSPAPTTVTTTYTAEDVRIQQYGDTAIVAFRLVGSSTSEGRVQVNYYLNSGTFLKRRGIWQAVNWQSTKMPRAEADLKKEAAAAEQAFHRAIRESDPKTLEALVDASFIWTHSTGEQVTREQFLDQIRSGKLKYSKLETENVSISIYGDTAIVRGVSQRERTASPDSTTTAETKPFTIFYTMTLVNKNGWNVVAMHSGRK
jgi:ketosteroid isomerase-like protein